MRSGTQRAHGGDRRALHVERIQHTIRHVMKPIQVVVDEDLLARVDRSAKRLKISRSAAIRRFVEVGLEQEAMAGLAQKEAEAYARTPETREERAAFRSLERSQQRVMKELSRGDRW
jgi:metal-responsive CopG/Arc/MetJ family transcriptional regulator